MLWMRAPIYRTVPNQGGRLLCTVVGQSIVLAVQPSSLCHLMSEEQHHCCGLRGEGEGEGKRSSHLLVSRRPKWGLVACF